MESYADSKKSIDINRDSGIVTDEDQHEFHDSFGDELDVKTTNYLIDTPTATGGHIFGKIEYGQDEDGDTILHLAVVGCTTQVVEDLISKCDELNSTNNMKQTPLHVASMANRPEMVELLLNGGARMNVHDWRGNTPLHLACERGFLDVAIILLETLRMNNNNNMTSSTTTTTTSNSTDTTSDEPPTSTEETMRQYLEVKNYDGQSCLHLAAAHNKINMLDLLINRYDIDLNCQDGKSGATILHEAITKFNDELVRYTLSCSNKHCNRKDFYGRSPLDMIALLQRSRLDRGQSEKLSLINELVIDRIKLCIAQNIGCCAPTSLLLNEAILDSSSSSDYTDSDSDSSN